MDRAGDLRRAIALSGLSVGLSGLFGAAAVVIALGSGRLSLLGFGFDAVMDSIASCVLIWRFRIESGAPGRAQSVERAAEVVVGSVLAVLAVVLAAGAISALTSGAHPAPTVVGVAIALGSVALLPPLAVAKRRTADRLDSGALRADATLTAVAAVIAGLSLLGFVLTEAFGIRAADPVGGLIVSLVLLREALAAARGRPQRALE